MILFRSTVVPGTMKEFNVEDWQETHALRNILMKGTSQLQVVAAIGGVINDLYAEILDEYENKKYEDQLNDLSKHLKTIRTIFSESVDLVHANGNKDFKDAASKDLVEMYSYIITGYLMLDEAEIEMKNF